MKLPSYNKTEFEALVRKGPGFGCWTQARISVSWGKDLEKRVTAKDLAKRLRRHPLHEPRDKTRILFCMLPEQAPKLLFPTPSDIYCPIRGYQYWIRWWQSRKYDQRRYSTRRLANKVLAL